MASRTARNISILRLLLSYTPDMRVLTIEDTKGEERWQQG
jgi:hypothetical protein